MVYSMEEPGMATIVGGQPGSSGGAVLQLLDAGDPVGALLADQLGGDVLHQTQGVAAGAAAEFEGADFRVEVDAVELAAVPVAAVAGDVDGDHRALLSFSMRSMMSSGVKPSARAWIAACRILVVGQSWSSRLITAWVVASMVSSLVCLCTAYSPLDSIVKRAVAHRFEGLGTRSSSSATTS